MPITHSAYKAVRRDLHRTLSNRLVRNKLKIALDAAHEKPTVATVRDGFSVIDRAVKKHLMHKNKAARLKSQLSKKLVLAKTTPPSKIVKSKVTKVKVVKAKPAKK
jgi:small subunit ribosomal protein S20